MKLARLAIIGMMIAMFIIHIPSAYADDKTDDFFRSIFGSSGKKLTDSKIIRGLKEALKIGTDNAIVKAQMATKGMTYDDARTWYRMVYEL